MWPALAGCRNGNFDNPFDPEEPGGLLASLGGPPLPMLVFSTAIPTGLTEGKGYTISFRLPAAETRERSVQAITSDASKVLIDGGSSAAVTFAASETGEKQLILSGSPDTTTTDDTATVTLSSSGYSPTIMPLSVLDFSNIYKANSAYTVNTSPDRVFPGDFDGDGLMDMAVTYDHSIFDKRLSVLRNTGSTSSPSFARTDFGTVSTSSSMVAASGDLNADGKPELVFTNGTNVVIYNNTSTAGTVAFTAGTALTSSSTISGLHIADLDGDGKNELILTRSTSTLVLLNNTATAGGTPTFTTTINAAYSIANGTTTSQIFAIDLNADGKRDLLVGLASAFVSTARNTSSGVGNISFDTAQSHPTTANTTVVTAGDIDGDGLPDLVAASTTAVSVLRNTTPALATTFTFAIRVDATPKNTPSDLQLADLNGNGKLDIVLTDYFCHCFSTFQNTSTSGTITLFSRTDIENLTGFTWPRRAGIADVTGDGKPELLTPNYFGNAINVYANASR